MGHYDNCREGYCGKCGAAPGNFKDGKCEFCHPPKVKKDKASKKSKKSKEIKMESMFDTTSKMGQSEIANLATTVFMRVQKDFYSPTEATKAYLEIYNELTAKLTKE